jgi:hypothetical protein
MKDLNKTKFCLGLQLEHIPMCILIHQLAYVQKVLEKFNMDKAYPSKTPMVVRALEKDIDPFRPRQEGEEMLGSKYPYLSVIGALMYLANNTRPNIDFIVNLLARYSASYHASLEWSEICLTISPMYTRFGPFLSKKSRFEPH